MCRVADINLEHLAHLPEVVLDQPGIGITLPGSEPLRTFVIDGMHRAARCRAEGRPFWAYVLDERESDVALLMLDTQWHY